MTYSEQYFLNFRCQNEYHYLPITKIEPFLISPICHNKIERF
ncbi:MAG: hypothetical protein ACJA1N_001511, partial [Saprospiraceae bacterium]